MATRKPRREATKTWETKPTRRRRGASGSVARAILNQAPQTTQQNAAGFMKAGGIDSFEPTRPTSVKPPPATGVGDPDRAPQTPRRARGRRTRAATAARRRGR
jgi:hypothetical protein